MARMFPPTIADDHGSKAEGRVFAKLRDETPGDWTVLHSVGLSNHASKPWAEIDFVVIAETGVFCLEVKGGRIELRQGDWYTNGNRLRQSPFAQAGGGASALFEYLSSQIPGLRHLLVGHGVLFPDVHFDQVSPEVVPELVYNDADVGAPMSAYIRRISAYWSGRVSEVRRQASKPLSRGERSHILHYLAPGFDLLPSLRGLVAGVDEELVRLTTRQKELLEGFVDTARVLTRGGAGTGKTLIACEEAIRLARSGKRTLYCCYSRRLAEHLRPVLGEAGVDVTHLHGLMLALIKEANREHELPPVDPRDLFDIYYPQVALDALDDLGRMGAIEALVLDEAQDLLKPPYTMFLDALLLGELAEGTWRIFLDPHQDVFLGAHPGELSRIEQYGSSYLLRKNCRNTREIATATTVLAAKPLVETLHATGPDVTEDWYADDSTQSRLVVRRLRTWITSGLRPDQIVVLSPRRFSHSILAAVDPGKLPSPVVDVTEHDATDGKGIRFSTVAGFKGLEADAVLLVDVDDLASADAQSTLYVGASRPRAVLGIALHERCKALYKERAADLLHNLVSGAESRSSIRNDPGGRPR